MRRSRRVRTLVRLAAMVERRARLELAKSNQDLLQKENQRSLLESYGIEYGRRWIEQGANGLAGADLARLAAFRSSIVSTQVAQEAQLADARQALQRSARNWGAVRNRLDVMTRLEKRLEAIEGRVREKRQQNMVDDLVASRKVVAET